MNKYKLAKALNIITNVLFVLVMVLLIIYLVYGFTSRAQNKVPSLFGQSYVRIMSNSMEASGFEKNEVAVIEKVNISEIKEGDIIAFYQCFLTPNLSNPAGEQQDYKTGENSFKDRGIIFHQVGEVYVDSEGQTWFRTYGTSNVDSEGEIIYDSYYVRGDYVVGKYVDSGLAGFLNFLSSTTGIIVVVIIPSAIVLFLLAWDIIQISDQMVRVKRQNVAIAAKAGLLDDDDEEENMKPSVGSDPKKEKKKK